jgi:hypothetical protein
MEDATMTNRRSNSDGPDSSIVLLRCLANGWFLCDSEAGAPRAVSCPTFCMYGVNSCRTALRREIEAVATSVGKRHLSDRLLKVLQLVIPYRLSIWRLGKSQKSPRKLTAAPARRFFWQLFQLSTPSAPSEYYVSGSPYVRLCRVEHDLKKRSKRFETSSEDYA